MSLILKGAKCLICDFFLLNIRVLHFIIRAFAALKIGLKNVFLKRSKTCSILTKLKLST